MQLHPGDYRAQWERILPGIRAALQHQQEGLRPEDVFAELKFGISKLFLSDSGFVILKRDGEALLVHLAYSTARGSVVMAHKAAVAAIAGEQGCKFIDWVSTRRGYQRLAPAIGAYALHTRWRMEV
jgi:hypothetical protein